MSREPVAFVCSHVFQKTRPVLFVSRADGDWQLLCGDDHDEPEVPRVVGLNHLLDDDPGIKAVLDLPSGWEAERPGLEAAWERRQIPR
ncbi:MAG TPA: hypothetical protein VFA20_35355 [Myxococcaceae bacterium]|nr:hypothetical protein [Myxococcaceae bacterium]